MNWKEVLLKVNVNSTNLIMEIFDSSFQFSMNGLARFLLYIKDVAPVIPLCEAPGQKKYCIIMRHDIDVNLRAAYIVAELEKSLGIRSTFFIMTTNPFYNPFSQQDRQLIRSIAELGFEIGLHYDPSVYPKQQNQTDNEFVRREVQLLEDIIGDGRKIRSISLHKPGASNVYPLIDGFINAYDPLYFSQEKYISDSKMERSFIDKCPYEFLKRVQFHSIQILLHPCQYTANEESFCGVIKEHLYHTEKHLMAEFSNLLPKQYQSQIGKKSEV
jgi:hypothetical protein